MRKFVEQKTALITGATRGLGYEIALKMAERHYRLFLTGRNSLLLEKVSNVLAKYTEVITKSVDLKNKECARELKLCSSKMDFLPDIIIHSAGIKHSADGHNINIDVLHETLKVNLEAGILINNEYYDQLKKVKGKIVHIGSTASLHFKSSPCYTISKAALHAYVKNTAAIFAKDGISIFGILPGILDHENSKWNRKKQTEPEKYTQSINDQPFGRFVKSSEVAQYIIELVEVNSPMISGSMVQIDGGRY